MRMTTTDHFQETLSTPGQSSPPPAYEPSPGRPARSQWPVIVALVLALGLGVCVGVLIHPISHTKTVTVTHTVTRTVTKPVLPEACWKFLDAEIRYRVAAIDAVDAQDKIIAAIANRQDPDFASATAAISAANADGRAINATEPGCYTTDGTTPRR
jgi:hypothetical protein